MIDDLSSSRHRSCVQAYIPVAAQAEEAVPGAGSGLGWSGRPDPPPARGHDTCGDEGCGEPSGEYKAIKKKRLSRGNAYANMFAC
jgi:hypothetical protein